MRSDITSAQSFTPCWCSAGFIVSTYLHNAKAEPNRSCRPGLRTFASRCRGFCDYHLMSGLPRFFTPLLAGLGVTLVQLAMAVCLLAPEEPVTERYSALIQHDSYWFMNIIDRGYQTIVPPIDHKVMEVSNVPFFPAYPAIAAIFRSAFN